MKKIVIGTTIILLSPFIVISVLLFFKINVFDNPDFWYGYMTYFGTITLGAIALMQNNQAFHQANQANEISKTMLSLEEKSSMPFLEFDREQSKIYKINNDNFKFKLKIENLTKYPIHNIAFYFKELDKTEVNNLYINGKIVDKIKTIEQLTMNKADEKYVLDTIACLRNITTEHFSDGKLRSKEVSENTEYLYLNLNINQIESKTLDLYIYMQNIFEDIYLQKAKCYIFKRLKGDYFFTMHGKKIEKIILEEQNNV